MRKVLAAAVLVVAAGGGQAAAARAGGSVTIPGHCTDAAVRPVRVVPGCDQTRVVLVNLRWTRWGGSVARATGLASVDTCLPDCAAGATALVPVRVRASGLRRCRGGARQYTRIRATPVAGTGRGTVSGRLSCAG